MSAMHTIIKSMLLYPAWNERPLCQDILSHIHDWSVSWEQITKNYSNTDLRSLFINFTENQFLYKFLSVKTGKGFNKIVLNKLDDNLAKVGKSQVHSVYRSNSVSRHWKSTGTAAEPTAQINQAPMNLNEKSEQNETNNSEKESSKL